MNKQEIEKAIENMQSSIKAYESNIRSINTVNSINKDWDGKASVGQPISIDDKRYIHTVDNLAACKLAVVALQQQLTNGWIPSPPLVGTECLAQTENNEIIHVYYAGDCKYHFVSYYDREVQSQVKYWQPLPERYKEV